MDSENVKELSAKVGAKVDNLLEVSAEYKEGKITDETAVAQALIDVGDAIKEFAPEFDVDAYLMGGLVAAAQAAFAEAQVERAGF